MDADPEYRPGYCVFHGVVHGHGVKVERHHAMIFAGRQVDEKFAILQICEDIHRKANWKQVKERLDWIMLNRASEDDLRRFSKASDLFRKREYLNKKYG